jgi:hypothetical protein
LLIAALSALLYFAVDTCTHNYRTFHLTANYLFRMSSIEFVLAIVATAHWVVVAYLAFSSTARNSQDQRRRHWLAVLSTVPEYRPELVLAEAVAASMRRMCVHLTPLPIYVLLVQLSGVSWSLLACFYLLLFFADFTILPVPSLPATTAASSRRWLLTLRSSRTRQTASGRIPALFAAVFFMLVSTSWLPGFNQIAWSAHILAPIHAASTFEMVRFYLAFPYVVSSIMSGNVEFFTGSIPPWTYILVTLLAVRVAAAFEVGAGLSTLEGGESADPASARRAQIVMNACVVLLAFFVIGYAWRAWVMSGDTSTLCGPASTVLANARTHAWSIAGLLCLIGAAVPPLASVRILAIPTHTRSGRRRRLAGMVARYGIAAARVAAVPLFLFVIVCLCGRSNPFPPETIRPLLRIAASTSVSVVFAAGLKRLVSAVRSTTGSAAIDRGAYTQRMITLGSVFAIGALFAQPSIARTVGACLPFYCWADVFPQSASVFQLWHQAGSFSGIAFWAPPSYATSLLLPLLTGIALGAVASMVGTPKPVARAIPRAHPTYGRRFANAPILAWVARFVDNPIFIRDLARSLPKSPLQPLMIVAGTVLIAAAFTWFQLDIEGASLYTSVGIPPSVIGDPTSLALMTAVGVLTFVGLIGVSAAGYWAGERILSEEQEHGSLGALLITPLKDRQIMLGRVLARAVGTAIGPAVIGACSLLFVWVVVSDPVNKEFGRVWVDAQLITLMVFACGVGGGALVSTVIMRIRWLRGGSLLAAFAGPSIILPIVSGWIPPNYSNDPADITLFPMFALGAVLSMVICALFVLLAYLQFRRLRRGDIDYGDQPAK